MDHIYRGPAMGLCTLCKGLQSHGETSYTPKSKVMTAGDNI